MGFSRSFIVNAQSLEWNFNYIETEQFTLSTLALGAISSEQKIRFSFFGTRMEWRMEKLIEIIVDRASNQSEKFEQRCRVNRFLTFRLFFFDIRRFLFSVRIEQNRRHKPATPVRNVVPVRRRANITKVLKNFTFTFWPTIFDEQLSFIQIRFFERMTENRFHRLNSAEFICH